MNQANVALKHSANNTHLIDHKNALGRFAEEATKFYRGVGGTEADIKRAINDLTAAQSPEARKTAIKAQAELMAPKINALQDRWKQDMGLAFCLGVRPSQAANSRPERNMVGSGTVAARAVAVMGPTPGMEASNLATGCALWI